MQPCNCEYQTHFDNGPDHPYAAECEVYAFAWLVGQVCQECATGHYAGLITRTLREEYLYGLTTLELLELQGQLTRGHHRAVRLDIYNMQHATRDDSLKYLCSELYELADDAYRQGKQIRGEGVLPL